MSDENTGHNTDNLKHQAEQSWRERERRYAEAGQGEPPDPEFDTYADRARALFENERLRDWVFAPFRAAFSVSGDITERQVRQTITGVALANAVIAGLPGKLGIGVAVAMALEAFMALRIAQHLGITSVRTPRDTLRLFGAVGATGVVVLWLFRHLLGFAFSLFNVVGALPATFLAELFVTNFVGLLFWSGFEELQQNRPFRLPKRAVLSCAQKAVELAKHQWSVVKGALSIENLRTVGGRLRAWFSGELVVRRRRLNDDAFVAAAMASILARHQGSLDGPLGQEFLQSIRDLYPDLRDADGAAIADYMERYDDEQMGGVLRQVKGRLHERLVVAAENADGDDWIARLHDDPYHESTDAVLYNTDTGETFAVSLKATDDPSYVERALSEHPGDPVMATEEAAAHFEGDSRVTSSGYVDAELEKITESNFDRLLDGVTRVDAIEGSVAGTSLRAAVELWPFVVAWMRHRITREQLESACVRILGDSGRRLVPRLLAAVALGPLYMWYALARGVMSIAAAAHAVAERVEGASDS